jgi:hypothetical protein
MTWWERLRRRGGRDEYAAADWVAAGSPLPDAEDRVEGLAFEVGQILWVQNHRASKPWPERRALVERVMTGPRWSDAGYRWSAAADECTVTDPDGKLLVRLLYDPDTGGHVVERYLDGTVAARVRYDEYGKTWG